MTQIGKAIIIKNNGLITELINIPDTHKKKNCKSLCIDVAIFYKINRCSIIQVFSLSQSNKYIAENTLICHLIYNTNISGKSINYPSEGSLLEKIHRTPN